MTPFLLVAALAVPATVHAPDVHARATSVALVLSPSTVVGGNPVTALVTLSAPAPAGGVVVTVTTSAIGVAGIVSPTLGPLSSVVRLDVRIPAGATSANVGLQTFGVSIPTSVTMRAVSDTTVASAFLTVNPASVRSMTFAPTSVIGGQPVAATVTLDGKAPLSTGAIVRLAGTALLSGATTSLDGSVRSVSPTAIPASVPPSVTVRGGASSVTFSIPTTPVPATTLVALVATLGTGVSTTFTVAAAQVVSLQLAPPVVFGGTAATGTVVLNGPASSGGRVVPVSASSTDVSIPLAVTVPAGSDRQTFPIGTQSVTTTRSVTIAARRSTTTTTTPTTTISDGSSNTISIGEQPSALSQSLTIAPPPQLQSVVVQPASVIAGTPATLSITFTNPAAGLVGLPSVTALVSSDHPEAVQLPASVPLASPLTLSATTSPPAVAVNANTLAPATDVTATIAVSLGTQRLTAPLTVILPIASFSAGGGPVHGGSSFVGSVTPAAAVAAQQVVTFTADRPDLVQVPASEIVLPGRTARVPFRSSAVTTDTPVRITAAAGAQRITITVTLTP